MKRLANIVLVLVSAMAITACGLRGSLERPPPLWGDAPVEDDADAGSDDDSEDQG
jgi:predicted small lipoprotein YifL